LALPVTTLLELRIRLRLLIAADDVAALIERHVPDASRVTQPLRTRLLDAAMDTYRAIADAERVASQPRN
jgi:hypothetical protein